MQIRSVKGFHDILSPEISRWHYIEKICREVFELYGYKEIRTPHLEYTELFTRSIGTTTDIVEKEMYTFQDRDGSSVTLRPEGTAGVVRSFIEHHLYTKSPTHKLYYMGSMYRHERPQKGRYRGFHQIGAEYLGSYAPGADVETIYMLWNIFKLLELGDYIKIEINSIGTSESRKKYKKALKAFLQPNTKDLCPNCKRKLETNPLRILDCKNENCKKITEKAPLIIDFITEESKKHFEEVKNLLSTLEITYTVNYKLVRGLDYYTETVFEFTTDKLGAQNAVAAGGRYNELVEMIGGPKVPAVGFAIGMERTVLLHKLKFKEWKESHPKVFVAWLGNKTYTTAFMLTQTLRKKGIPVEFGHESKSLKSQLKKANKSKAPFTLIVGEEELEKGIVKLRDMEKGIETNVQIDKITELL